MNQTNLCVVKALVQFHECQINNEINVKYVTLTNYVLKWSFLYHKLKILLDAKKLFVIYYAAANAAAFCKNQNGTKKYQLEPEQILDEWVNNWKCWLKTQKWLQ